MAKKSSDKIVVMLCSECKNQNYITVRNKVNMQTKGTGKLTLRKYCKFCKKVTAHKESSKLK